MYSICTSIAIVTDAIIPVPIFVDILIDISVRIIADVITEVHVYYCRLIHGSTFSVKEQSVITPLTRKDPKSGKAAHCPPVLLHGVNQDLTRRFHELDAHNPYHVFSHNTPLIGVFLCT